jgi:hypothetical protein
MRKIIILLFVMLLTFSGCAMSKGSKSQEGQPQYKSEPPNQAFYGFPDVPIPKELTLVPESSFVYETPTLKVGVLVFDGNVELQSLENYFRINMAKNGWKFINSFRYKDVVLNFTKEGKTCNIKMSRNPFSTAVEVWVGPYTDKENIQKGHEPK